MASSNDALPVREVQRFHPALVAVVVIGGLAGGWIPFLVQIVFGIPLGSKPAPDVVVWILLVVIGVALPALFLSMKLVTEIARDGVRARLVPFKTRVVPLAEVKDFRARQYRPIREFGGWGARWRPGWGWCYNARGNRGLEIDLADGRHLMLGSQDPEKLAGALRAAMRG